MTEPTPGAVPAPSTAGTDHPTGLNAAEAAADQLLGEAHLLGAHELPALFNRHAVLLGVQDAVAYLVDLQQAVLVPFLGSDGPDLDKSVQVLPVDSTLAGRAFQHVEMLVQDLPSGAARVWLPLLDGADRLGVLAVTVADAGALREAAGALTVRLRRFAALAAELLMCKTMYGDTVVRLRRRASMGLAAEMQWSLLPPLTFACAGVTVAAALEPAYQIAGDTVDYAVDAGRARVAVFDGMGHGLLSAQLATMAVAAYRNARRSSRPLTHTAAGIDSALLAAFGGESFCTAVLAELDTDTGRLEWISAGHPEPLLLRDGRLVKSLHVDPAPPFGLATGVGDGSGNFQVGAEQLQPDDRVLFYTDGVTEARSPTGDFFGVERLVDLLTRNLAGGLPTPETMRRVVRAVLAHQQGQLTDDATLLLLEWRSSNQRALVPGRRQPD